MIFDLINAVFEFLAGIFVFVNCYKAYKDKELKGVSIYSSIFFTLYSLYSIIYFGILNQFISFYIGIFCLLSNLVYLIMFIKYK